MACLERMQDLMLKTAPLLVTRPKRPRSKWKAVSCSILICVLVVSALVVIFPYRLAAFASSGGGAWPTYLEGNTRSGFNSTEKVITPSSAPNLKLHWSYYVGGSFYVKSITTQPVEANGLIYWGSWDGNEHATNLNGTQVWQKGIGYTFDSQCDNTVGVASTATFKTLNIGGTSTPVLFVGGGNATFYALNANTGATIWSTSLGSSPDHFIYSSPAFYKGSIYIGLASFGDCPLVQGQLIRPWHEVIAGHHTHHWHLHACTVHQQDKLELLSSSCVLFNSRQVTAPTTGTCTHNRMAHQLLMLHL